MPIQKLAARRSCTQAQERNSLRGLTRTFVVSRTTVPNWIKKSSAASPLRTTLVAPDPEDAASTTLELDERMARLCSKNQAGLGVDCPVSQVATGRRGCGSRDRSLPDVSTVVGSHPISLP